MLYEQQEVMRLVPTALASLGWFAVVNEAEKKMSGSVERNTMLFLSFFDLAVFALDQFHLD